MNTVKDALNVLRLPRYRCHKVVSAVRILSLGLVGDPGRPTIIPDDGFAEIEVTQEWVDKHNPQAGGYYVVYEDGYASFSPAEAFEKGYSRDIGELEGVLRQASSTIRRLRETNQVLGAKVEVMDIFAKALNVGADCRPMGAEVDIAWRIDQLADQLSA